MYFVDQSEVSVDNAYPRSSNAVFSIQLAHQTLLLMFRNYLKVGLRGLLKTPLNSSINIFGLAAAIGICIFAYAFARWTYSTDQFHLNKHSVYLVTYLAEREGSLQQYGKTPRPLGEVLKQDFPQIKNVCRVEDGNVVVKYDDKVFHERIRFADAAFLDMFTFPLKWGNPASLKDPNSIILSEEMSVKYFGNENPIGKIILVKFDQVNGKAFKVSGVAKEFPKARTIGFNFLINFNNLRFADERYDMHDWAAFINATLIQVENPADLKSIQARMNKYKEMQNKAVTVDWQISSFTFEQLASLHERSEYIRDDISRSSASNYKSVIYLAIVSSLMLALACFNYINIAIVTAAKRLKEIGVRKSIGASRSIVIFQFLSENVLITTFALIFGLILGYTVFIPGFEQLFHFSMDFRFDNAALWIFLPVMLLVTSFASGIYPSLYISRFHVVDILKGSVRFGSKNPLTKVLLSFQLILACLFITSAVMFSQNTDYLSHRSWGYEPAQVVYSSVPDQAAYEKLHALMSQESNVVSLSGSAHQLGKFNPKIIIHFPDQQIEVDQLAVDARYFNTMSLQLKAGRGFRDHESSDRQSVVVNEMLVKNMRWENAIGQLFRIDSIQYEVIGVVRDFHSASFFKMVPPTVFTVAPKESYRYLSMKVKPGTELESAKTLQSRWLELFPETPYDGGHQEDVWGFYFEEIRIHSLVWRVLAIIAVTVASLGLYGLMSLNVAGRVKEFSIRKVLGAGVGSISSLLTRQYALLFTIALVIGVPLSYTLIKLLISSAYSYHMPITFSGVTVAASILILVVLLTLSTQIRKVMKANPVDGLKTE
jgi:putative ABC transport system permease protein